MAMAGEGAPHRSGRGKFYLCIGSISVNGLSVMEKRKEVMESLTRED